MRIATAPQSLEIGVIGAGVIGLSSALWLQKAGHRVTVFDRNLPEDEASYSRAASYGNACTFATGAVLPVAYPGLWRDVPGMLLDPDGPLALNWRDLPDLLPWLVAFMRFSVPTEYRRITSVLGLLMRAAVPAHEELMAEAGSSHMAHRDGCLYLWRSAASFDAARREIDLRQREGVAQRVLEQDEIREREPHLAPLYHRGLLFETAWRLDSPYAYLLSLAALFRSRGGRIARASIRGIETGTKLQLVGNEAGDGFDKIVIAAGAWSGPLARSVGERVLLNTERGYHVLFPDDGELLSAPTCYPEHGFYMTPLAEGLRCAGTVELGGLDCPPRPHRADLIERVARVLLPGIGKAGRSWLGFRPSMPDSLPVIGAGRKNPRVIHAYGHGHIGLTLGAVTGRLVAEIASGFRLSVDVSALAVGR
jgi:D-amino-acid dehydrogenase